MAKYLVVQETVCPECNGSCVVQHPAWEAYWKEHISIDANMANAKRWFETNGLLTANTTRTDGFPDEEIICHECDGKGSLVTQVDLETAMKEMGYISGKTITDVFINIFQALREVSK